MSKKENELRDSIQRTRLVFEEFCEDADVSLEEKHDFRKGIIDLLLVLETRYDRLNSLPSWAPAIMPTPEQLSRMNLGPDADTPVVLAGS